MNLFSVFDPTSYFGGGLNWVVVVIMYFMSPLSYYVLSSEAQKSVIFILNKVGDMFKEVGGDNYFGIVFVSVITFLYLVYMNLMGLFPFIFTPTAHPIMTLGLGLCLWVSFFLMGWMKNFKHSAAHLVPEGSPVYLSPIMVLIESISHLMRPFTLSIRLAANMMAGHLIVGLLASISMLGGVGYFSSVFFQSFLLILEFGVSVIQGFVFSILLLLYALEYY